jgi:protein phosphatase
MGGHAAGEVASKLGVETIIATFAAGLPPADALREAFNAANAQIYTEGRGSMGTTGVAALFLDNALYVANVGDSRAYLIREGQIAQISHDHSFVSDQVAAGLMTAEQARTSNVRNIITRALGYQPEVQVDVFDLPLRPGDTVLLSSDGMHGLIEDGEIAEVASMLPPEQAVQRLIDTANERGGHDNITVVIAQVDEIDLPADGAEPAKLAVGAAPAPAVPPERRLSRVGLLLAGLTLIALVALGALLIPPTPALAPSPSPRPATVTPAVTPSSAPSPSARPSATPRR